MSGIKERFQRFFFDEQKHNWIYLDMLPENPTEQIYPTVGYPPIPELGSDVVWGIDMSGYWDGIVNWQVAKDRGAKFCIIKACDGTVLTRFFRENVAGAKAAGLVVGAYFWLYKNIRISGKSQATAWWNSVKTLNLDMYCVDFETTYWNSKPDNPDTSDLYGAVIPFEQLSGKKPIIYSAPGYFTSYFNHAAMWADYPLWIAHYGVVRPNAVAPWGNNYLFWQLTDRWPGIEVGADPEYSTAMDGDIFNGTIYEFNNYFNIDNPPPPPVNKGISHITLVDTNGNQQNYIRRV